MVKEHKIIMYECSICGNKSKSKEGIEKCESRPVSQDKGVKVGDIILITTGEGAGKKGKVTDILIYDQSWGHYAWERYWHTIGLTVDLIDYYGSRQLTFDDYEVIP